MTAQGTTLETLLPSGIELLQAVRDGRADPPAFATLLGMDLLRVEDGLVEFVLAARPELLNPHGTLHGGVIATVLDSAMGAALQSTLPPGVGFTTMQLNVHYLRAVTLDDPAVRAVGQVVHRGGRTATAEARLYATGTDALLAHASSHLMVLR
jgi:uncharacterized protein (TIGR00369 family)